MISNIVKFYISISFSKHIDIRVNSMEFTKESPILNTICDPYGRRLNNIRLSITQRCALNCFFCHREGEFSPSQEMSVEEIVRIARIACEQGMRKVKITGGQGLRGKRDGEFNTKCLIIDFLMTLHLIDIIL